MRINFQKGSSVMEGVIALAVLLIIIFLFVIPTSKLGPAPGLNSINGTTNSYAITTYNQDNTPVSSAPLTSPYSSLLFLSTGNAPYVYQPSEEYISLYNSSQDLIDITGWKLQNGRGQHPYDTGGNNLQYFPSIIALIPKAAGFISPTGQNFFQDVILRPGDNAIITTGAIGSNALYPIVSFKENECSGYLQQLPDYTFNPTLSTSCVPPYEETGVQNLDLGCQSFISSLGMCQTPKFDTTYDGYAADSNGNTCVGCVNGTAGLSNACVAFIKAHFSYPGCLVYHSSDPNFYGNTWRIYLNKPWEMWGTDHESISLFDLRGNLAAYTSY